MAESLVWICGWFVIPIYLARSNVSAGGFIVYGLGTGLLISLGNLATSRGSFSARSQFIAHLIRCCLALLFAGGIVFLGSCWLSQGIHI